MMWRSLLCLVFITGCSNRLLENLVARTPAGTVLLSVAYHDMDRNGKLDHARLTFDRNVDDSTFDGYDAAGTPDDQLHNVTTSWTISGRTNLRLDTRDTVATLAMDTVSNDETIWIAFDELGVGVFDTDETPELQANEPRLRSAANSRCYVNTDPADCTNRTTARILGSDVTETDSAPPYLIRVSGQTGQNRLALAFSEPVAPAAGGCAGVFAAGSITYTDTAAGNAGAVSGMADSDGCADALLVALTDNNFAAGDIGVDTVSITVYDAAGNAGTTTNRSIGPVTPPFLVNVWSVSATAVRIRFSEPVVSLTAALAANYSIPGLTITGARMTAEDEVELDTSAQAAIPYTLTIVAPANIVDLDDAAVLSGSTTLGYTGLEPLRVVSATSLSTTSVRVTFSRPISSSTPASYFRIVGPGSPSIASVSISGLHATLTLDTPTSGGLYTVMVANNQNGDGFDDSGNAVEDTGGTDIIVSALDRAVLVGGGTEITTLASGPLAFDAFGDGSNFTSVAAYNGRIITGPNRRGYSALSFAPDGTTPIISRFRFNQDTTASWSNADEDTNGNILTHRNASSPYSSIGFSGCTPDSNNLLTGCGPDNENGRGEFRTLTLGGTEYLFLTGTRDNGAPPHHFDYLYYTADQTWEMTFRYVDLNNLTHFNTQTPTSMVALNNRVYIGIGNINQTRGQDAVQLFFGGTGCVIGNDCDARDNPATFGRRPIMYYQRYFGGVNPQGAPDVSDAPGYTNWGELVTIDSMVVFRNFIYYASGGHHAYRHNGGVIRSANATPAGCTAPGTGAQTNCAQYAGVLPAIAPNDIPANLTKWHGAIVANGTANPNACPACNRWSLQLSQITDLKPHHRAFPAFAEYSDGNLYLARNTCEIAESTAGTFAVAIALTPPVPCATVTDPSRGTQVWRCIPGGDNVCDPVDWSLIAENGTTGLTNFGNANNRAISMLIRSGSYLYLGFDNAVDGVQIYRTNAANPVNEGDWTLVSPPAGLGVNATQIFQAASVQVGANFNLFIAAGDGTNPAYVFRQRD